MVGQTVSVILRRFQTYTMKRELQEFKISLSDETIASYKW
jgi:hypothetical protein